MEIAKIVETRETRTRHFHVRILADRTNGDGDETVTLMLSSSVTLCIVAKRCVLEQKLLLTIVSL